MSLIDIIGVVSGVLGIVQFAQDAFPAKESEGSNVRIAVGLDSAGGLTNAGGNIPGIALFNEVGKFLGQSQDNGKVTDGTMAELRVDQSSGQQATYGLFQAGNDAVCIAYVSITWPDGNQYAIPGDWGEACGGSWYYSNVYIQNSQYKPKCMWIDGDGNQPQTGFQVHFPEFRSDSTQMPAGKDIKKLCNSKAPFQLFTTPDPKTIDYWNSDGTTTSQATVSKKKRSDYGRSQLRSRATASNLVITNSTDHGVSALCSSKTSSGPDMANLAEKSFCRMSDKKLFPICDTATKDNCFNSDSNQLIVGGKATRETYNLIWDWMTPGTTKTRNPAKSVATREVLE